MISPKSDFTRERKRFREVPEIQLATAREYYDMGQTAEATYQKPGTPGRKTTQKLFKYWNEDYLKEYDVMQLTERQIIAKRRFQTGMSDLIFKLHYQLSLIENEVEGKRKIHQTKMDNMINYGHKEDIRPFEIDIPLEQLRLKIILSIRELRDYDTAIEIQPVAYEIQDETILNTLRQREEMLRDKVAKFRIKDYRRKLKDDKKTNRDYQ
ncbi:MAG: hypothetical protein EPO62_04440 [Candidatus Nitrosotenuis sp.]|nr:MAG: hypothetical protein EPO62_04440 [Candidatus Nitrosotenuis sp.]